VREVSENNEKLQQKIFELQSQIESESKIKKKILTQKEHENEKITVLK
jgi:hypothetical protein